MKRIERGEAARLPHEAQVHVVAARYGQTPAQVRDWPADDFMAALAYLPVTGLI